MRDHMVSLGYDRQALRVRLPNGQNEDGPDGE